MKQYLPNISLKICKTLKIFQEFNRFLECCQNFGKFEYFQEGKLYDFRNKYFVIWLSCNAVLWSWYASNVRDCVWCNLAQYVTSFFPWPNMWQVFFPAWYVTSFFPAQYVTSIFPDPICDKFFSGPICDKFFPGPICEKFFPGPICNKFFPRPNMWQVFSRPNMWQVSFRPNLWLGFSRPNMWQVFFSINMWQVFFRPNMWH